jgi:hypothetical protein
MTERTINPRDRCLRLARRGPFLVLEPRFTGVQRTQSTALTRAPGTPKSSVVDRRTLTNNSMQRWRASALLLVSVERQAERSRVIPPGQVPTLNLENVEGECSDGHQRSGYEWVQREPKKRQ